MAERAVSLKVFIPLPDYKLPVLFGKLLRIPYWQCLGIDTSHPLVQREVEDWYENLLGEGKPLADVRALFGGTAESAGRAEVALG